VVGDLITVTRELIMTDPEHSKNPAEANITQYQPGRENFDGGLPPDPKLSKADRDNLAANEQAAQDDQRTQTDGAQAADANEQETAAKQRKTTKR
jgi:hypothetical protein